MNVTPPLPALEPRFACARGVAEVLPETGCWERATALPECSWRTARNSRARALAERDRRPRRPAASGGPARPGRAGAGRRAGAGGSALGGAAANLSAAPGGRAREAARVDRLSLQKTPGATCAQAASRCRSFCSCGSWASLAVPDRGLERSEGIRAYRLRLARTRLVRLPFPRSRGSRHHQPLAGWRDANPNVFGRLGYRIIRGAPARRHPLRGHRGSARPARGGTMALTPDDPRAASGSCRAMLMARSGAALVPVSVSPRARRLFGSLGPLHGPRPVRPHPDGRTGGRSSCPPGRARKRSSGRLQLEARFTVWKGKWRARLAWLSGAAGRGSAWPCIAWRPAHVAWELCTRCHWGTPAFRLGQAMPSNAKPRSPPLPCKGHAKPC